MSKLVSTATLEQSHGGKVVVKLWQAGWQQPPGYGMTIDVLDVEHTAEYNVEIGDVDRMKALKVFQQEVNYWLTPDLESLAALDTREET